VGVVLKQRGLLPWWVEVELSDGHHVWIKCSSLIREIAEQQALATAGSGAVLTGLTRLGDDMTLDASYPAWG